jgi:hypothetical protein
MTIQGKFKAINVNNGYTTEFTSNNGEVFNILINSLIPEDGGGRRYLINFNPMTHTGKGYIDFKTMEGYIK